MSNDSLSVDNDNAEADALEGNGPCWSLLEADSDYRRRYVVTLLNSYRQALVDLSLLKGGDVLIEENIEEVF